MYWYKHLRNVCAGQVPARTNESLCGLGACALCGLRVLWCGLQGVVHHVCGQGTHVQAKCMCSGKVHVRTSMHTPLAPLLPLHMSFKLEQR